MSEEPLTPDASTQFNSDQSFSDRDLDPAGTDPGENRTRSEISPEELKQRRRKSIFLGLLIVILLTLCGFLYYYFSRPAPLPELLPIPVDLNYPPHYLFSIYEVDRPVSVATSPDGERLYVAETGGERLMKIFDRDGGALGAFGPPGTSTPERSPVYLAVTEDGRVLVSDRAQHGIFVYDADGNYLDTVLMSDLTLSEYLSEQLDDFSPAAEFTYNVAQGEIIYSAPNSEDVALQPPADSGWAPLGVRLDQNGRMLVTDVAQGQNVVYVYSKEAVSAQDWTDFPAPEMEFGEAGAENGQFSFPNNAVVDSRGRFYVVDGNNSRISVWDPEGEFLFNFGLGVGSGALNLPRGAVIDGNDRLYVADAVGQAVKVYDVSGDEVAFLFAFGDYGIGNGLFNYPNDIVLSPDGRIYVADRENDRVQVWLY